jgi:hypothetical protein
VVIAGAIVLAFLAQYLFDHLSLFNNLPERLRIMAPALADLAVWPTEHLLTAAILLLIFAGLGFGLTATPWSRRDGAAPVPRQPLLTTPTDLTARRLGRGLLGLALLISVLLTVNFVLGRGETMALQIGWALSMAGYLAGGALLDRAYQSTSAASTGPGAKMPTRPEQSWPYLLAILTVSLLLFSWNLANLPIQVDRESAGHGLQALELVAGRESRIFAPGWANRPLLAYAPAALGILVSRDWLVGARLAGVLAGLLTLLGTWLVGCELFRRTATGETPSRAAASEAAIDGERMEDGRWLALLATVITAIGYTFIHFSRLPLFMEPVAWGTLGLWALLRGVRTRSRLTLGLSGLLFGLGASFYASGWILLMVACLWWAFLGRTRRPWSVESQDSPGWIDASFWLGGIFVFLAPSLGYWIASPAILIDQIAGASLFAPAAQEFVSSNYTVNGLAPLVWKSLRNTALTFNYVPDASPAFGYPGHLLDSVTAPLLVLGIGFLMRSLNRSLARLLLSWFGIVLIVGGVLTVNAPFWPGLLPLLPAAGLITALALDRGQTSLSECLGDWVRSSIGIAIVGGLLLVSVHNWLNYHDFASANGNPSSYVGRLIRQLPPDRVPVLLVSDQPEAARSNDGIVQYLLGGPFNHRQILEILPDSLPEELPPHSTIILHPADRDVLPQLERAYPGGVTEIRRNRVANPVSLLYILP